MKSDTYTKFVLTIIAVCLIWIATGGPSLIPGVQAQGDGVTRVRVVGWDESMNPAPRVKIVGWTDQTGIERTFPLPVRVVPQR
jgi:hypothetical protein